MKQQITEEMKIHEEWYKEAKGMTLDKLPDFLNHLMNDYDHDYGTVCHALAAGGMATMWAMDHHEQGVIMDEYGFFIVKFRKGGITGFQAGAVMWEFIRRWGYPHNKTALKIVDYDNFLYPQYEDMLDKIISADAWAEIQKEAAIKIKEVNDEHEKYIKNREQYEKDIAIFIEKYPDYRNNPEKYEHLSCGTGAEWEREAEKVRNGFEFAPQKPYDGLYGNSIYIHWQSIINGIVPFGYRVVE